ncbi:hypothetical protein [Armatimonas sp.]|uniref:hypothetical protein n=1 Tax=Armatimonas sp. TaxID=1872638 RepID=UPI00374DA029
MTESEQTKALQAAFPTEPISDALKQRVENLTPLAPIVTGYKFKFRHAFATFAVLWIGHNVPTAIKVWNLRTSAPTRYQQLWIEPKDGKRILHSEAWSKGNNCLYHLHAVTGIQKESISYTSNSNQLIYYPNTKSATIQNLNLTLTMPPLVKKIRILEIVALLMFRAKDNRTNYPMNGQTSSVIKTLSGYEILDNKERYLIVIHSASKSTMLFKYDMEIEDDIFIPKLPKGTTIKRLPDRSKGISDDEDIFKLFLPLAKKYLTQPHP